MSPHSASMPLTSSTADWPNRWPRLASETVRLHSGPVAPFGQGTFGGEHQIEVERQSGVDAGTVWSTSEFFTGLSPTSRL